MTDTNDTTAPAADDADGWAWAEGMMAKYGQAPDDLPARTAGQSEADYRATVEQMMAERAQAAAEPPSAAVDGPTDAPVGDAPGDDAGDAKTAAPVEQSTGDANDDLNAGANADATAGDTAGDSADGDHQDDDRPTNEAAKYRLKLRATEAELAETRAAADWLVAEARHLIDATRQATINHELGRAGLDPALLTAAGYTGDTLLDDSGLIDHDRLGAAIEATIQQFNVDIPGRPRRPAPVGAVGRGSAPLPPSGLDQFTAAFKRR